MNGKIRVKISKLIFEDFTDFLPSPGLVINFSQTNKFVLADFDNLNEGWGGRREVGGVSRYVDISRPAGRGRAARTQLCVCVFVWIAVSAKRGCISHPARVGVRKKSPPIKKRGRGPACCFNYSVNRRPRRVA